MSDNVADPLEQLSLAYKQFGETMADSISKTYEIGVRYGAGQGGEHCRYCQNEACNKCGAGCWSNRTDCQHDHIDRHAAADFTDSERKTP